MIESRTLQIDGVEVHFLQAGQGPPVVLVHGLMASALNWDLNMPALANVRTVYALDLANMGQSGRLATLDPGLAAQAERLAAFIRRLGLPKTDIVAHSHGGAVSLMLAALHPGLVRRMVLFSPANPFCNFARRLMAFYLSPPGLLFARTIPWLPRFAKRIAFVRVYADPGKVTADALRGYLLSLQATSIQHALGIIRAWWPDMEELRRLLPVAAETPTLLLWGDRDNVVSLASGRKLATLLHAELHVIPHAGHLPFADQAEVSNREAIDFLTRDLSPRDHPSA